MDAIVLVGGLGSRLRPLTQHRHKSLVPVCNRPAIQYLFDWLSRNGVERIVLAIGQHNEDLAEAFPEGWIGGCERRHVVERQRLESGGAIRHAVEMAGIRDRFLVLNGDVFVEFDLARAVEAHSAARADLTLALTPVEDPSQFGVAVLDADGMVTGFVEKPPHGTAPGKLVNAGAWLFERKLVDEIPEGAVRVEETLFPSLVARARPVLGYEIEGLWADIGTPERYRALNLTLAQRRGGVVVGERCTLGGGAIGDSVVGDDCVVRQGATVRGSVLWERCDIGEGALVEDSVLADGVSVAPGAIVRNAVLARGTTVTTGSEPEP